MVRMKKFCLIALIGCIIAALMPLGLAFGARADGGTTPVATVKYYNGGFWGAMMTNNDFKNAFKSASLDVETDTLRVDTDVDANVTAWGAGGAIDDAYCDWTAAKSLVVEVKNNSDFVADFRFYFSGYADAEKTKETYFSVESGKKFYYKAKDGSVSEQVAGVYSPGGMNIPANFDGYIVMPVSELKEEWQSGLSLTLVKRVNIVMDGQWSRGDVTFGKVGYTADEGAQNAGVELTFDPVGTPAYTPDENANDLKIVKNWLYGLSVDWLAGQLKDKDAESTLALAENADELGLRFENVSGFTELWCDNFSAEDRDLSNYKYFLLDVKNNAATDTELGFVMTTGTENANKIHYGFRSVYLRAAGTEGGSVIPKAALDGINVTIPAGFDGYLVFELDPASVYNTYLSTNDGAFDASNVGSISFFIKAGMSGDLTIRRPAAAKSNRVLDTQYPIAAIVDNDTETARFRITGASKDYDGEPISIGVSEEFENACTISWYAVKGGTETPLDAAPTAAGEYKVKARATGYLYEDELRLDIRRADPSALVKFQEKTYHAKDTVAELSLAADSLAGTVTVTPITLALGKNTVRFQFVPDSANYKTINASVEVTAVHASPESLIKFVNKIYYAGETVTALTLASDSLAGTITAVSVKLIEGSNSIAYTFTPQDTDYAVFEGTYEISAIEPAYTLKVENKIYDGTAIVVEAEGYPFEYTLKFYRADADGEYVEIDAAPSEIGRYRVVLESAELGVGKSAEFEIKVKPKRGGCNASVLAGGNIAAVAVLTAAVAICLVLRKKAKK